MNKDFEWEEAAVKLHKKDLLKFKTWLLHKQILYADGVQFNKKRGH